MRLLSLLFLCLLLISPVNVAASNQQLSTDMVYNFAENYLNNKLMQDSTLDFELELLTRLPPQLTIPPGEISFTVDTEAAIRFAQPTQVAVTVMLDNRKYINLLLSYRIKKFQQVLVAATNINNGETLNFSNVTLERRDTSRAASYITDFQEVQDMVVKRSLSTGSILLKNYLGKQELVARGATVTIISNYGNIKVSTNGMSLQGGGVGETVRVRNLSSGKTILATVVDKDTVKV